MNIIIILRALVVVAIISSTYAMTYNKNELKEADKIADSLHSWKELYSAYLKYHNYDDGGIAEGFSESTSLLLANKWMTINQLIELSKSDPSFQAFVIRHIDETVPVKRLQKIKKYAMSNQDPKAKPICLVILKSLKDLDIN